MKKFYVGLLLIGLFSLVIAGCGGGGGTPTGDQAAINALLDTYATAMKNENADQVAACFTDPFTSNGTSTSLANYKLGLGILFGVYTITNYQVINRTITVTDSSNATVTANEVLSAQGFGDQTSGLISYTLVNNGGWKISALALAP